MQTAIARTAEANGLRAGESTRIQRIETLSEILETHNSFCYGDIVC
jgi:hypothetical protein